MTPTKSHNIGVIGTGTIGLGLIDALVAAGLTVQSFDPDEAACRRARVAGSKLAASPEELARTATLVFLSLPAERQHARALHGSGGLLSGLRKGAIVVDTSTISPAAAREAAAACARAHAAYLDAPVSGRPPDLTIFVGGERGALARARPVLELLSQKIHYMGPSGSGAVTKIANQYLMLVNFLAAVQCTELGDRHGLDPHRLTAAVQHGSGQSFALEIVRLFVLQGEYSGHGSPLALIRKDIELIDALWGRTELPLWAEVREYYVETMRRFDPSDDFWSAAKVVIAELSDD